MFFLFTHECQKQFKVPRFARVRKKSASMGRRNRPRLVMLLIALIAATGGANVWTVNAQVEDTATPALAEFDFNPKTIDVSPGPQTVTVTLRITDDLSGFEFGNFIFISPSGQQISSAGYNAQHRVSGNSLDGVYQVSTTIPQFSEAGTWRLIQVFLRDQVGNSAVLSQSDLISRGFPTELVVNGGPDLASPDLVEFSFNPTSIDVSAGAQSLTLNLRITDTLSGFEFGNFIFLSPSGNQIISGGYDASSRVSGDSHDGVYQVSSSVPQFSEAGNWRVIQVFLRDSVGNSTVLSESDVSSRGFPTQLQVVSDPQDITSPSLTQFSFTPATIDTSAAPQSVTLTLRITDDVSGFEFGNFIYLSPSGQQVNSGGYNSAHRISGTAFDGVYEITTTFPQFSEVGTWHVIQVFLRDAVGNSVILNETDLVTRGFPATLTIAQSCTQLTALGPAQVWLGLKNSDDVGTRFDLRAEVLRNGMVIGSGQLDSVPGGSSGFNNAVLRTINPALFTPINVCPGDTLSLKLSVRIAANVAGHRSGTARLWFNDSAANSQFSTTIGGAISSNFLLDGFGLGSVAGSGPKKTIDVFVDRAVGGNPFKPFGVWSKTF